MASSVAVCDSIQNSQLVNWSINLVLYLLYSLTGRLILYIISINHQKIKKKPINCTIIPLSILQIVARLILVHGYTLGILLKKHNHYNPHHAI